jgi:hypothetical protein
MHSVAFFGKKWEKVVKSGKSSWFYTPFSGKRRFDPLKRV